MTNTLKAFIEKVGNMQEQIQNVKKERWESKLIVKNKKHYNRNKTGFDGLMSGLHMAKERINKFEWISIEDFQMKGKEKKMLKSKSPLKL